MSLPDESAVDAALEYLARTDAEHGRLVGRVRGLEHQRKVIKGLAYLDAEGTVQAREAQAYSSATYRAFVEDYENAWAESATIQAKRKRAELTIDVWRSLNAGKRKGNI